jgi:hypothetical protein
MRAGSHHVVDKEPRFCQIEGCSTGTGGTPGLWFCRSRCQQHYMAARKHELEGRVLEIAKIDPARPKWVWEGDEKFLIDRLENDAGLPQIEETENGK